MERLIDIVGQYFCAVCDDYSLDGCKAGNAKPSDCPTTKVFAKEIITRVGTVVLSGKYPDLDELLKVLDRTTLVRKKKGNRFWDATGFHPGWEDLEIQESERTHQAILVALGPTPEMVTSWEAMVIEEILESEEEG